MVAVKKWRKGMEANVTMRWYRRKQYPRKEMYDGSWESALWFRARMDSLEINGRTHHWVGRENTYRVCKLGVKQSVDGWSMWY